MSNNLANESSPYLLQHKDNPVNWYPWGKKAFEKAKNENKPVFLSLGYSTCHWCHVMAHESFEDTETAEFLNKYFVSVKVDREERPDIDSIYMSVCQAMTGGGGWPMSLFLTPEQKPFFAGTYFPKPTFQLLLKQIHKLWQTEREKLVLSGNEIEKAVSRENSVQGEATRSIIDEAYSQLERSFDKKYGGFGNAPKFPMPHNLMFLMDYYRVTDKKQALDMVEYTLTQMYKGGIFDHIGGGFSRYSTDRYYLAPHFEKMLYDNALLIISYINAYAVTNNGLYREIAERTAEYIMREMTDGQGGFYSAQDADSDGEEGKYYTFNYDEILELLGKEAGEKFNDYYGITKHGNFEGKNIPNLLGNSEIDNRMSKYLLKVYEYRKSRTKLHLDDKILTSWNGLMIATFARLYRIIEDSKYLDVAEKACSFIEEKLAEGDTLYVSYRNGIRVNFGFIDDYAFYIHALICLYEATFKQKYLDRAVELCHNAVNDFYDNKNGGFYLYGSENEQLIMKPKETYDGAIPSGNSVMAYNLVMLSQLTDGDFSDIKEKQLEFMAGVADGYPSGYCFYMSALLMNINPPTHIVCALVDECLPFPVNAAVRVIEGGNENYPIVNGRTTYYVCKDNKCLLPTNDLAEYAISKI